MIFYLNTWGKDTKPFGHDNYHPFVAVPKNSLSQKDKRKLGEG
jgi:hypothetical protein